MKKEVTCLKVWAPDVESEPEGTFHQDLHPKTRLTWFQDEPVESAAYLYALELWAEQFASNLDRLYLKIAVRGTDQKVYHFNVRVYRTVEVEVCNSTNLPDTN